MTNKNYFPDLILQVNFGEGWGRLTSAKSHHHDGDRDKAMAAILKAKNGWMRCGVDKFFNASYRIVQQGRFGELEIIG